MKIAINVHPLKSGHKDRGIGYYTSNLIENLKKNPDFEIQEFTNPAEIKNADIVHYPWFDFFFHTLPLRKKFKTVVTIHDVIPLLFPAHQPVGLKGKYNFLLQKIALKNCKNIITDSNVSKNDIAKVLKISKEKISVVHLAANENFKLLSDTKILFAKRKYNLPDRFLLYVGDANWVKNLPFLIRGFKDLIQDLGFSNVKLVLAGAVFLKKVEKIEHPELKSLKEVNQLIADFDLEKHIIRPGNLVLDDLVSFYNLATVYIQPSLYEGFGLTLLEAFACGTPVISSNKGSLSEIGGDAAVYFNPTNRSQFVAILKEILQNKSIQNKLSKLGLDRAQKFSWNKVIDETIGVYSKVLGNE
ncbi:MAG: glycosyltransferase family 1 protein [Candidatus Daviesbacteria bacterium]|nr:glycosyltransferase family 1 protein [Candidatus Daviesbacteria bacterium]